jgi:hypothetical protein
MKYLKTYKSLNENLSLENNLILKRTGERFWIGLADKTGEIIEVHTFELSKKFDFHVDFYFEESEKAREDDAIYFWGIDIESDDYLSDDIRNKIMGQVEEVPKHILRSEKSGLWDMNTKEIKEMNIFEAHNYKDKLFNTIIDYIISNNIILKIENGRIIGIPRDKFSMYKTVLYDSDYMDGIESYISYNAIILDYYDIITIKDDNIRYKDALKIFYKLKKYTINHYYKNKNWYKLFENWKENNNGNLSKLYNYLERYKKHLKISDEWLNENKYHVRASKANLWDLKK